MLNGYHVYFFNDWEVCFLINKTLIKHDAGVSSLKIYIELCQIIKGTGVEC